MKLVLNNVMILFLLFASLATLVWVSGWLARKLQGWIRWCDKHSQWGQIFLPLAPFWNTIKSPSKSPSEQWYKRKSDLYQFWSMLFFPPTRMWKCISRGTCHKIEGTWNAKLPYGGSVLGNYLGFPWMMNLHCVKQWGSFVICYLNYSDCYRWFLDCPSVRWICEPW